MRSEFEKAGGPSQTLTSSLTVDKTVCKVGWFSAYQASQHPRKRDGSTVRSGAEQPERS